MPNTLTLSAAFLLGLVASGHCLLMCGGISAALGLATAKNSRGRPNASLLLSYHLGRIASYAFIGLLMGGLGSVLVDALDLDNVRKGLRVASALALFISAFVAFGIFRDPGFALGSRLWRHISQWGRCLLPVTSMPRAIAFGMLWGWMPCGFVYTVLIIATLSAQPGDAAATMLAFGLGTIPALFASALGLQWITRAAQSYIRQAAGILLLASAILTFAGPWLVGSAPWLHRWLPFDCG